MMSYHEEGSHSLLSKIDKLSDALRGQVLIGGARSAANLPLNRAKILVPVDTGTLERSLHQEDDEVSEDSASVKIGTDLEYAGPVEFGTSRMPSQPYLRPAFEDTRDEMRTEVIAAVKDLIRAAIG